MSNINHPFTPSSISEDEGLSFSIPLYQRLFEWGEEQITQLLDDLYSAYQRDCDAPYYIGMLTAKESGHSKELVDGQQRFTAMVLLGIHFGWKQFLTIPTKQSRLQFYAREEDKEYLVCKIEGKDCKYKNENMEKGLSCIKSHLQKDLKLSFEQEKKFGDYIYSHLSFFLSKLPDEYTSQELNTYFERMNTAGKSLENYEILKVDVIRRLGTNSKKELYTSLWNAVSIMEKTLLRRHHKETTDCLRGRFKTGICKIINENNIEFAFENKNVKFDIEELDNENEENSSFVPRTIAEIEPNPENPFKIIKRRTEEHSLLTFPEFLLQVLFICLGKNIGAVTIDGKVVEGLHTTDFFDVRKLGKTFQWAFEKKGLNAEMFMNKLALYRLLTDYFIIRMDDEDEDPYPFELYMTDEDSKSKVKMYLSMLYSASSAMTYYMWMPDLLLFLEDFVTKNKSMELCGSDYLKQLKQLDDIWHPKSEIKEEALNYQTIDRYWFWRIDYYLWENRNLFFPKQEERQVAENYIFRRNRSIEHIAPQHPNGEFGDTTRFYWDDENHPEFVTKRDCIGNLVMISSGQNSALTNSCFEVKRAVMQRYTDGNGHVESLKMLYVYSHYPEWSIDNITEHSTFSIDFLKATYRHPNNEWEKLINP